MKTISLKRQLTLLRACNSAVEWAGDRDFATAWAECERADWMLWLCAKMIGKDGWPEKKQIVLCAADIAESVLPIFEEKYPNDSRPREAIEAARAWSNGKGTNAAAAAAAAAAADTYAAYAYAAAADAAYAAAAASAAYAAYAAAADTYAAYAYAAAADAAAAAAYAAAADRAILVSKRKEIADLVRKRLTVPKEIR